MLGDSVQDIVAAWLKTKVPNGQRKNKKSFISRKLTIPTISLIKLSLTERLSSAYQQVMGGTGLLAIVLALLVYHNTLDAGFVYDDRKPLYH
ncbi:hypothetical protein O3M35_007816 [Rhynocoris fuscipes]|uniref:Uncharacterized protein n=1 Tax=Rhynocoris fuscipes TaxID=488301 RepID=A0AAW1DI02_9HEMI